jgi:IclR family transcriptional regulator, KDG regulon repressor
MVRRARQTDHAQQRLSSVANAVLLLKTFLEEQVELSFSALVARSGISRSTVHRLIWTLVDAGMLERNEETGKFRLGIALFELASLARRRMDVSFEAKPWMMTLRDQTGEAVNLSILERGRVVCVNFLESSAGGGSSSRIGSSRPAHCTAEGKVLIAFQSPLAIERIIGAKLEQSTPRTLFDPVVLQEELATIRVNGYATEDEEYELGVRGIAAPIKDERGNAVAAVGITGPTQRLTKARLLDLARFVAATANGISLRLGDGVLPRD